MSDDAVGDDGYLLDKGLIPLPASARAKFQMMLAQLQILYVKTLHITLSIACV